MIRVVYLDHCGGWGSLTQASVSLRKEIRHFGYYGKKEGKKFLVTGRVVEENGQLSDWDAYVASAIHSVEVMERATKA